MQRSSPDDKHIIEPAAPLLFPLRLRLRPSKRFGMLLSVLHLLGLYAFWQLAAQLKAWLLPISLLILYSLYRSIRLEQERKNFELICHQNGEWSCPACGIEHEQPVMIKRSTDFGWAIWLYWKNQAANKKAQSAIMLCADHFQHHDAWRHFRIWTRYKAVRKS